MPAYNEQKNIRKIAECAILFLKKRKIYGEVIIVDDGSSDETPKILSSLSTLYKNLRVIYHKRNEGYGATVYDGLRSARNDLIFFTDSDGQFDMNELDDFLEKIKECDAVIGYRKNRSEGWVRKMNAKGWALVCYVTLGVKHKDIDCAFKLMKKSSLEKIEINSKGAAFSAELLHKLKKTGASIVELPVTHYKRESGRPTGAKLSVIVRGFKEIFILRRSLKK
jgi:glycosyltransferase involved in cell wall biosynthesis